MVIESADRKGSFTDVDEAAAIVYAVDHGARIINRGPADGSGSAEAIRKARRHAVALS